MKSRMVNPSPDSSIARFEREFVKPKSGATLIVGSMVIADKPDRRKLYPECLGVDMRPGPGVDRVADFEDPLDADLIGAFDHVECNSMLEHTPRPWLVAANVCRAMRPGATLYVTMPVVWRIHGYPGDYWRCTGDGLRSLFRPHILWDAMKYCGEQMLEVGDRLELEKIREHPYIARTQVAAFGRRAP